jgi:hypothetical protein
VSVIADDHVGAGVDGGPGDLLLAGERRRVVLRPPVRKDDDQLRAGILRLDDVLGDDLGGQRGTARLLGAGPVARGDRVVGQDADLDATRLEDRRPPRRPGIPPRAACRDPVRREVVDRLDDPRPACVPDVVVRERHPVDAGVRETLDEGRIGGEDRP